MSDISTLELIKTILDNEMEMPEGRVFAYNAAQDLPKDKNLFIVLSYTEKQTTSNNIKYVATDTGVNAVQSVNTIEEVLISLLSVNNEARDRTQEVFMAVNSDFARQLQEKEHFHIQTTGSAYDASFLEATNRINRFDIKLNVFRGYDKIKSVEYFDKFPNTGVFEPAYKIED